MEMSRFPRRQRIEQIDVEVWLYSSRTSAFRVPLAHPHLPDAQEKTNKATAAPPRTVTVLIRKHSSGLICPIKTNWVEECKETPPWVWKVGQACSVFLLFLNTLRQDNMQCSTGGDCTVLYFTWHKQQPCLARNICTLSTVLVHTEYTLGPFLLRTRVLG